MEDLFCNNNTLYHSVEIKMELNKKKRAPLGGANIRKKCIIFYVSYFQPLSSVKRRGNPCQTTSCVLSAN